jgi:L-glyceraldehyde reductase
VDAGKIRSIGVSNFTSDKLDDLLKVARIPPAVNQIEAHPYLQQPELTQYSKDKNILTVAYSPLGNNIYGVARYVFLSPYDLERRSCPSDRLMR